MRDTALRWAYLFFLVGIIFSVTACSLFSSRDQITEVSKKKNLDTGPVSRDQYNVLLSKYDALTKRIRQVEKNDENFVADLTLESQEEKKFDQATDLITKLNSSQKKKPQLIETVDVFTGPNRQLDPKKIAKKSLTRKSRIVIDTNTYNGDIQMEINRLTQAKQYLFNNKLDAALQIFKDLENSKHKQVKVRAQFFIGEVLFKQGEYDLAMQVFEDIINKYAFSGIILKTLGRLVVCSDKLRLKKKYDLYYSILHDFFETT